MVERYKRDNGSIGYRTKNDKPSFTKQEFAYDCNTANVIRRIQRGEPFKPIQAVGTAKYGDLTRMPKLREMHQMRIDAKNSWNDLPAKIRNAFPGGPEQMIQALNDKYQYDKLIKLGVLETKTDNIEMLKNTLSQINETMKGMKGGKKEDIKEE